MHRQHHRIAGFIPPSVRARVSEAIARAERQTSGEIVAVVAAESDTYFWAPILVAALLALAIAAPMIFFTWINVHWIYLTQLVVFALGCLVLSLRPLRYALVPQSVKRAQAHARAVDQFLVQNLHTTPARTGVLIFVSVAERYAEILADAGIHSKVEPERWQAIVGQLTDLIGQGRTADGFVTAIDDVGALLAKHFPPGMPHDPGLPNHLIVLA